MFKQEEYEYVCKSCYRKDIVPPTLLNSRQQKYYQLLRLTLKRHASHQFKIQDRIAIVELTPNGKELQEK